MKASLLLSVFLLATACGGDDADSLGVAAECTSNEECDEETEQVCLLDFKGGYCGIEDCLSDADCPAESACIAHDDGANYCFRTCAEKSECNAKRSADNEANCSSSADFVDGTMGRKACIPPSN